MCRDGRDVANIIIEGIEQVQRFKYLGSIISEDGRNLIDTKARIELVRDALN